MKYKINMLVYWMTFDMIKKWSFTQIYVGDVLSKGYEVILILHCQVVFMNLYFNYNNNQSNYHFYIESTLSYSSALGWLVKSSVPQWGAKLLSL